MTWFSHMKRDKFEWLQYCIVRMLIAANIILSSCRFHVFSNIFRFRIKVISSRSVIGVDDLDTMRSYSTTSLCKVCDTRTNIRVERSSVRNPCSPDKLHIRRSIYPWLPCLRCIFLSAFQPFSSIVPRACIYTTHKSTMGH